jgi:hypothetical protein
MQKCSVAIGAHTALRVVAASNTLTTQKVGVRIAELHVVANVRVSVRVFTDVGKSDRLRVARGCGPEYGTQRVT